MFNLIKPNSQMDFMKLRRVWLGASVVAIVVTLGLFFTRGLNYGIDFTGGAEIKVKLPEGWDTAKLRGTLEINGLNSAKILTLGEPAEREFLVRLQLESNEDQEIAKSVASVQSALKSALAEGTYEIKSADIVGPSAGGLLRKNGFLAMFYVLVAILLYVAVRFDFRYAPGAVLALFHDVILVVGVFIVSGKEFDLTVLAAILALIGYSNNDTIIVFDRVREVMKANPSVAIESIVNQSINQTLGRTLMTSLSTFVSVAALWLFGGKVLEPFAFALMVGIVVGTYSSIFIASSLVVALTHYQNKKDASGRGKKRREVKLAPEASIGM